MENWIPEDITKIVNLINGFVVGGAVRDHLLKKEIYDYDVTTPMTPDEVLTILKRNGYKTILTGIKYGTISAVLPNYKNPIEITTYRSDTYTEENGRMPDVQFHINRNEDLMRRDFTINSIAYDVRRNEYIDINNGIEDLFFKNVRFIGNSIDRINEDPLRMIRACRLSATLGFEIYNSDIYYINLMSRKLETISKDRIVMEVKKVLKNFSKFIENIVKCSISFNVFGYNFIWLDYFNHDNRGSHYGESILKHTIDTLKRAEEQKWFDLPLQLALLYHDSGKPSTMYKLNNKIMFVDHEKISETIFKDTFGKFTGLDTKTKKQVEFLISNHMRFPAFTKNKLIRQTIDWKMSGIPMEWIENLGKLAYCDRGISYENMVNEIKKIWNIPQPDGNEFLHVSINERKNAIRNAWIQKIHNIFKCNIKI